MTDWRGRISDDLKILVDRAVTAGAKDSDVFAEVTKAIEELRVAYDSDPDPADAPSESVVDEPANEWPAADK